MQKQRGYLGSSIAKRLLVALALLTALLLSACGHVLGTGRENLPLATNNKTVQANLPPFNSLSVHGPFNVDVRFIPQQHYLDLRGNLALVDQVSYFVQDGVLHVFANPAFNYPPSMEMLLTVEMPMITKMHYRGTGKVTLFNVDTPHLLLIAEGRAYFNVSGKTARLDATFSGQSRLNAKCLYARTVFVNTTDMAQAEIANNRLVNTLAASQSDIYYYDNPIMVNRHERESGSIMRMKGIAKASPDYLPLPPMMAPKEVKVPYDAQIVEGLG